MMDASINSYSSRGNNARARPAFLPVQDLEEGQVPVAPTPPAPTDACLGGLEAPTAENTANSEGDSLIEQVGQDLLDSYDRDVNKEDDNGDETEGKYDDEAIAEKKKQIRNAMGCFAAFASVVIITIVLIFLLRDKRHVDEVYMRALVPNYTLWAFNDTNSSQSEALQWVLADPDLQEYPDGRLLQRLALATLFHALNGTSSWKQADGWLNYSHHECEWTTAPLQPKSVHDHLLLEALGGDQDDVQPGRQAPQPCQLEVVGDDEAFVLGPYEHLELYENHLVGNLPPEVAILTALKTLVLDANSLTGSLPTEIRTMSKLEILSLRDNELTGRLPGMEKPNNLKTLVLSGNQFTGTLGPELQNITHIENLVLDRNKFQNATLPTELDLLSRLE
ncbi:Leucine Rich Repeat [Seminavis robusta]|nr:Leucine Rich Repeat [Seminavis robusta]|eukprot:Sro1648_g288530.1 Leucine Rich Repeat (392) ;mRNA; f:23926-25101